MTGLPGAATTRPRTLLAAGATRILLTEDPDHIEAVQRLRFDVFAAEPGFSDSIGDADTGRDADRFDEYAEHLIAVHDDAGIIGCARLLPPPRAIAAGGWYTAGAFDLGELDSIGAATVEMGRAAVATGHRHGSITALLWAALLAYLEHNDYRYLMGSVSVPVGGPDIDGRVRGAALRGARDLLRDRHLAQWRAHPLTPPTIDGQPLDRIDPPDIAGVPPLMRAYLRLGARVCGDPAIDEIFDVGDFVTVLDRQNGNSRYLERLRATCARLTDAGE